MSVHVGLELGVGMAHTGRLQQHKLALSGHVHASVHLVPPVVASLDLLVINYASHTLRRATYAKPVPVLIKVPYERYIELLTCRHQQIP